VGGWERSKGFPKLAAAPAAREKFVATVTNFCLENRFAGVDIDWEHPASDAEYRDFATLLAAIRKGFEVHHLQLTIAVAGWQTLPAEAIAAVDRVHLMAYDAPGRHSTYEFAEADVARLVKSGVPPAKICLGVPFYGRSIHDQAKTLPWSEIVSRFKPASGVDEVEGLYFNGIATIERKTNFAMQQKLAGVMVWEIGQDASGDESLLRAISRTARIRETDDEIQISLPDLAASVRKQGYVSGVAAQSLFDKTTGFRDAGFGLDIVDWIMEPGSDEAYRSKLDQELVYRFNTPYHGKTPKRSIEGPQICTQAKRLNPRTILGKDFVAVTQQFQYRTAAPDRKTGSLWQQAIVFPEGKRYFISSDKIRAVNSSDAMFLRIDMPGHIKHTRGDSFSEVYLSYHGTIPASEFFEDFAPDEKFNYRRGLDKLPERFIRAYHLHDPKTGKDGPWLAGMTLAPDVVSEAWCHQRGYVCLIEEFGGRPVKPGESFSAAFVVGFFDSIEEMHGIYDRYAGHTGLEVNADGWTLTR
jgi:hypothetical protein